IMSQNLGQYGYLPPPDPRTSRLQTKEGIEKAIRVMQRFGGVPETGILDEKTLKLMSAPRCSLPDIVGSEDMLKKKRRKRYALSGLKWHKTELTWSVHNYPSSATSPQMNSRLVDDILTYALKAWSDAAPLRFQRVSSESGGVPAGGDIRVSFASLLHDDGYPFDGEGGTLAHAFFPSRDEVGGDTHFDDHERWSFRDINTEADDYLFTVAVHEFGHALGLSHSSTDPSIMRPYYQGPVEDMLTYQLAMDDKMAIQQLYGLRDDKSPDKPDLPRLPSPPPNQDWMSSGGFDAVANIRGEVFFFRGDEFWRTKRDGSLISLNPARIRNFWMGLPSGSYKIDAVYERKADSRIVFFIGSQYWVFKDTEVMSGYPKPLSDWGMKTKKGQPVDKVEAAFIWDHNGKTYLFSGGEYWRFSEVRRDGQVSRQLDAGFPRDSSVWKGVPTDMDDITSWGEGDTYFFKDDLYWVVKRGRLDNEEVTPKSIGVDWLRCPSPTATPAPPNPRNRQDCSCSLRDSAAPVGGSLFLFSLYNLVCVCVRVCACV
uniref:Peptidase metallopeptidase domain-containing protein n=1 Tax=Periophthalmus magnuspinnatus TaxID=409849 RepID=A0A3B3ZPR3_9GOBI